MRFDRPGGQRFCGQCGKPLSATCSACGADNPSGRPVLRHVRDRADVRARIRVRAAATVTVAERRLVSVLFADLVGYTTLCEHRDPEEVRELLSRYFDRCRA